MRRIDNADAMLVTPDQGYFVRENLKLRLLSARLALLSRNQTTLKSDLHAARRGARALFRQRVEAHSDRARSGQGRGRRLGGG